MEFKNENNSDIYPLIPIDDKMIEVKFNTDTIYKIKEYYNLPPCKMKIIYIERQKINLDYYFLLFENSETDNIDLAINLNNLKVIKGPIYPIELAATCYSLNSGFTKLPKQFSSELYKGEYGIKVLS